MEKLICITDFNESLKILNPEIVAITMQFDRLDRCPIESVQTPLQEPIQRSSEDLFLELYSRFIGTNEADNLSWQTRSFRESKGK